MAVSCQKVCIHDFIDDVVVMAGDYVHYHVCVCVVQIRFQTPGIYLWLRPTFDVWLRMWVWQVPDRQWVSEGEKTD